MVFVFVFVVAAQAATVTLSDYLSFGFSPAADNRVLTPELLERIDQEVFGPPPIPFFDAAALAFDRTADVFACQGHRAPPVSVALASAPASRVDPESAVLPRALLRHRVAGRRQRVPLRSRPGANPS